MRRFAWFKPVRRVTARAAGCRPNRRDIHNCGSWLCAVLTVGSYIWVFLWEACIAVNLWITIVLQVREFGRRPNPTRFD
jgi:hypothetical protein